MNPAAIAALGLVLVGTTGDVGAATANPSLRAPSDLLTRVGFDQHLGARVPLEVAFRNARGATVQLGELIRDRPTVLVPGYYGCANLCEVIRAGVAQATQESGFSPGKQFNVVLISIDPRETPAEAAAAQHNDALAHPEAAVRTWSYLTGAPAASAALAGAIGYRYLFDPRNGQYDHASGIVVLSPEGRITQYLFGVQFMPLTLRLALVNAAQGRIGNIVDRLLLLCCDYDVSTGRYGLLINRVMQALGVLTALSLGGLVVILGRRERQLGRFRP